MVFLSFVRGWWSTVLESSPCGQSEDAGDGDTAADTGSDLRERHQSQALMQPTQANVTSRKARRMWAVLDWSRVGVGRQRAARHHDRRILGRGSGD
jgi:hypothetical protein